MYACAVYFVMDTFSSEKSLVCDLFVIHLESLRATPTVHAGPVLRDNRLLCARDARGRRA